MRAPGFLLVALISIHLGCVADDNVPLDDDEVGAADGVEDAATARTATSRLWGQRGERFSDTGPLLDWSFAGYRAGERALPAPAVKRNVRSFGAVGDGRHDDTRAFKDAIAATSGGALFIPEGRYRITEPITIDKGNLVLRGAGVGKTVITIPRSLSDVDPGADPSFGGSFFTVKGADRGATLTQVVAPAARGARTLKVASATGIQTGSWILVTEKDQSKTLIDHLNGGLATSSNEDVGKELVRFPVRVTSKSGNTLTLDRALPVSVEMRWSPTVRSFRPTVQESGIEELTIRFDSGRYPEHFKEKGYNAITLNGVANGWVRNVKILNADYGVSLNNARFSTVLGVTLDTDIGDRPDRFGMVGHHGLNVSGGSDNLVAGFSVNKTFVHDITVDNFPLLTVFSNGRGTNLNIDSHRRGPYGTLFSNLDMGRGTRPFDRAGAASRGPQSARHATFWNLHGDAGIGLPRSDYGAQIIFAGIGSGGAQAPDGAPRWSVEGAAAARLAPENLFDAMRGRRLGR